MRELCPDCGDKLRDRSWRMLVPGASRVVCDDCGMILRVRYRGCIESLAQLFSAPDGIHELRWRDLSYNHNISELTFKEARLWVQVSALQRAAIQEDNRFLTFWCSGSERSHALMYAVNGQIVGYIMGLSCWDAPIIGQIYVRPEFRRQGIATKMVHEWARRHVKDGRFGVSQANRQCIAMMAKAGFDWPDHTRAEYFVKKVRPSKRAREYAC